MHGYKILEENSNLRFKIPLSCLQLKEASILNSVKEKLLSFIVEYVEISTRYGIAEILGEDFCTYKGYSYTQKCIDALENDLKNGIFGVFGDIVGEYSNISLNYFNGTKLFYYNTQKQEYAFEYIYDVYGFKNLNQYLASKHWGLPVVKIHSFRYSENYEYFDTEEQPIYFDLGVSSNLFYQYLGDNINPLNNSAIAYRNTLRYNSFIKSLSDLWVNKYNWELEWIGATSLDFPKPKILAIESPEGIFLDGKIRYYEDLMYGKLEIPMLSIHPA